MAGRGNGEYLMYTIGFPRVGKHSGTRDISQISSRMRVRYETREEIQLNDVVRRTDNNLRLGNSGWEVKHDGMLAIRMPVSLQRLGRYRNVYSRT